MLKRTISTAALAIALGGCPLLMPRSGGSSQSGSVAPPTPTTDMSIVTKFDGYCVETGATLHITGRDAKGGESSLAGKLDIKTEPDVGTDTSLATPVMKSLELLGKPIKVTVTLAPSGAPPGAPPIEKQLTLEPKYCPDQWLGFGGEPGEEGHAGDGATTDYHEGGRGGNGANGGDGPTLTVEAGTITGPDGKELILVAVADDRGTLKRIAVHDPAQGPLHINAAGGAGGKGGSGGFGSCAGGGPGGDGGDGGRGGNVTLVLADASLEGKIEVAVAGGDPGGQGYPGGDGTMMPSGTETPCPSGHPTFGHEGRSGRPGTLKTVIKKKPELIQEARATCATCRGH